MGFLKKYRSKLIVGSVFMLPLLFYVLLSLGKHNYTRLSYYGTEQKKVKPEEAYTLNQGSFRNSFGDTVSIAANAGKITMWHLIRTDDYLVTPAIIANLQFLQDRFKDRKEVQFAGLIVQNTSAEQVSDFCKTLDIDTQNWQILWADSLKSNDFARLKLSLRYKTLPDSLKQVVPNAQVVLVDQNLHIRGYFDGGVHKEVKGELLDAVDMLIREQYVSYKKKKRPF